VYDHVVPYPGLAARIARQLPTTESSQRNAAFLSQLFLDASLAADEAVKITSAVFLYTWGHLVGGHTELAVGRAGSLDVNEARLRYVWGLDHLLWSFRQHYLEARAGSQMTSR
jgi:hypothetical protein